MKADFLPSSNAKMKAINNLSLKSRWKKWGCLLLLTSFVSFLNYDLCNAKNCFLAKHPCILGPVHLGASRRSCCSLENHEIIYQLFLYRSLVIAAGNLKTIKKSADSAKIWQNASSSKTVAQNHMKHTIF